MCGIVLWVIDLMEAELALPKLNLRIGANSLGNGAIFIFKELLFIVGEDGKGTVVFGVSGHKDL